EREEILVAAGPGRVRHRALRPDEAFGEVDVVVGAELGGRLPVLPEETVQSAQLLADALDPELVDVRDLDRHRDLELFPLEGYRRLRRIALGELVREPLVVLALRRLRLDAQRVVLGVIPVAAP